MPVKNRYKLIDVLRGVAIALMVYFHFSYDLTHFGYTDSDFYHDPYWLHLRTFIVSLFLLLVGVSLVLATRHGIDRKRFLRRLGMLVFFSLLISINSYFMFPGRTIYIGILHFIALATVLGLLFVRQYWLSLFLGIGIIALDLVYQSHFFNQPWIHWVGLMTHKPATEDYVPLIPWFGVVLIGIFAGQTLLRNKALQQQVARPMDNPLTNGLALAGRHSLLIYLVHQPILFGTLWLIGLF